MRKIVGISSDFNYIQDYSEEGYKKHCVNEDYSQVIEKANGLPLIIPISQNRELIRESLKICDYLLLSGGSDVDSFLYGEERTEKLLNIKLSRDSYEKAMYGIAKELHIPILGICRGMQLINVLEGGTLFQDLSYCEKTSSIQHNQKDNRHYPSHFITLTKNSFLKNIFDEEQIAVNSFHHQCVKQLASSLEVSAISSDDIIEAFQSKSKQDKVFGIQWHPEKMQSSERMMNIFKFFLSI